MTAVSETASRRLLRRSRPLGVVGIACSLVIVIAALAAVFGSTLAPHDPDVSQLSYAYGGPSGDHLLGWDGQGRDLFSRLLVGARTSMIGRLILCRRTSVPRGERRPGRSRARTP